MYSAWLSAIDWQEKTIISTRGFQPSQFGGFYALILDGSNSNILRRLALLLLNSFYYVFEGFYFMMLWHLIGKLFRVLQRLSLSLLHSEVTPRTRFKPRTCMANGKQACQPFRLPYPPNVICCFGNEVLYPYC